MGWGGAAGAGFLAAFSSFSLSSPLLEELSELESSLLESLDDFPLSPFFLAG